MRRPASRPAFRSSSITAADRAKGAVLRRLAKKSDLIVTSYSLLQRDIEALRKVNWRGVVLDEAQNVKNPETKQAKAARGLEAGYRVALTGTPVENNVGDLWSIMEFLNPGLLGTQAAFKRTFFVPIQASRDENAMARLKTLTGPFLLRRLKTDRSIISDLPEKMEMKVYCTLTREQASLYAAVVEEAVEALESSDGIRRKGVVLATLSKLKQVCNHPAQFLGDNSAITDRSGKLARLVEMLEEILETGERALIFTQFAEMGEIIRSHLQETFGDEVPFLHGGVAEGQAGSDGVAFPGGWRAFGVSAVAQGGRHRPEPDRRQPRVPLRPVVEPGGGGSGHRSRFPHRPDASGTGSQVSLRRHTGRKHRRHDRTQEGGRLGRGGNRRELAHRAVDPGIARCHRLARGRFRRLTSSRAFRERMEFEEE